MDPQRALRVLALLVMVAGCAGRPPLDSAAVPPGLPPTARVAAVPFHPQAEKACGPAALAMVLEWAGDAGRLDPAEVYTPGREGSMTADMVAAARRHGRLAVPVRRLEAVLAELAAGHPVLVFQNLGLDAYPVWHFAVAIGYDLPRDTVVLHSGTERELELPLDTFVRTWERGGRWAMVVTAPDLLPATAAERDALAAAAGLERARRTPEAVAAYESVLGRWPDSAAAAIGLANARHALGDPAGAEAALRRAVANRPELAAGWNNLAHVLLGQGRREEARRAARRAVTLDPDDDTYAATLAETAGE
ncbi:PA2778 family cysteine peptidase [Magnetospirillum sp. UT-4]|uniref:PA2778 family cysteine peptidase n=1 Tax=Magnetospirillum sp. UT-4 TaxID=2681467 RepID=UPI00137F2734|nr:PA2778 family cysteine peptidase [Magnetospirillum sp. UT-4]CAA7616011.1 conserved exported hypothetical protein [Magnetospirillum sp. UT-4]